MTQSKTIKIFLASSIKELHEERLYLCDYIMNSVRPIFKNDGIEVELFKCEDIHIGYSGKSAQEVINDILRECDISVFLFKKKAGKDTLDEFGLARELQKTKHHEIYVYSQDIADDKRSDELKEFLHQLEEQKENRLYWKPFKDVNSIEKQFVIGLLQFERKLLGIKAAPDVEQESETEHNADARFAKYESNEKKQAQLREKIHQDIDELLQQVESVMEDESDTIAARIFKAKELYEKADLWASKTDYDKEKYSDLLFNYAWFLLACGLYRDSEAVWLRQIPLAEELYGIEDKDTATSYSSIGLVYNALGNFPKALEYYFKALKIQEKKLGTDHPDTATTYNNIGLVYREQGDYPKALEYYLKALEIQEKVFGIEKEDTAQSYMLIGSIYKIRDDYPQALEYCSKALNVLEKVLGTEHLLTAESYFNVGTVYHDQGNFPKALEYFFKAQDVYENVLGTAHPGTALLYHNIGIVYKHQDNYPKALEYYSKALEIREEKLGTEHPATAQSYSGIGVVYYDQGNYSKALEYIFKALEIQEKVFGIKNECTAESNLKIGSIYKTQGEYSKALEYSTKASEIFEKIHGTEHTATASSYSNIGSIYQIQGDETKALEYHFKAL